MIAASEPLEFVPHGRTVLARHPTQIYGKAHNTSASENSLLYKLTNFAIKDESLLEARADEEKEFWCVREVCCSNGDNFEEDSTINNRETKCEQSETLPQGKVRNEFNISIKSELLGVKKMDTDSVNSATTSRGSSANSSSDNCKKFNMSCGSKAQGNGAKSFNFKTDCSYEEELYVKGCTAVWSKGLISTPATKLSNAEQRETICCFTIENPIKHATFANFFVTINNTMLIDALNSQIGDEKKNIKIEDTTEHLETKVMPSVLLIDNKCMKVFALDGREYVTSIPFQVKNVWPMKYGVLFEKDATPLLHNSFLPMSFSKMNDSQNSTFSKSKSYANMSAKLRAESISGYDQDMPLPTCFSLAHPLDEVTPILMKSSHGLQYYNDGDMEIIFVSKDPSIILLYDWKLSIHSLWRIRKATRDECLMVCPNINSTTTLFSQSCDGVASPMHSNVNKNTTNWATGIGSPMLSRKVFDTPNSSRSKLNSPMANMFHQQGISPHASIEQFSTSVLGNTGQAPPSLPLYPDICLDHIWTDTQILRRDPIEGPSDIKTFLHTDIVGHDYLCFMVKTNGVGRLQVVRLKKSHSHGRSPKVNLIVGSTSTILAKDAVVLDHLKMIALIDESGNIMLQSGNNSVGKVHVGGVLARLLECALRAFPRRSSLLPSRGDTSALEDPGLHLLSPVPHAGSGISGGRAGLRRLRDAAGSRLTLEFEGGAMYRVSLPPLCAGALVSRCTRALTSALPPHIASLLLVKWYGVRNAPGARDLTPDQEWGMFADLLLDLIGYDVERLARPVPPDDRTDHTEVATKKQRTSSDGTHDDWEYLLDSKLHKAVGGSLATLLNLNPVPTSEVKMTRPPQPTPENGDRSFNTNAVLFPYTAQILYALHLVYEEIKLNTLLWSDLKPLASLLYQVSKDLRLVNYVNHYWLDFPTDLDLEYEEGDSQMSDGVLSKLSEPSHFTADPPNVFGYIDTLLKGLEVNQYPHIVGVNDATRDLIEVVSVCGSVSSEGGPAYRALAAAAERGLTLRDVESLPPALALLVLTVLLRCKGAPPPDASPRAYRLLMREDLAALAEGQQLDYMETLSVEVREKETAYSLINPGERPSCEDEEKDTTGLEHLGTKLLALLYPRDRRISEVCNLLQSSTPVSIDLTQRPEVSDHDFIEEQEKHLLALSTRTMALPIGRGMVCLRCRAASPTESLSLPVLCVSGRGPPPRCSAVSLPGGEPAAGALLWPSFHNGAAAGLALAPAMPAHRWIVHDKPKGASEMSAEHAGFLLALGLNGHLREMPFMQMYEYLVRNNEMTSVGLLLGLAATHRGTMDVKATKMMSIHLEPLLPATSIELDVQQNVVVSALLGLGLLYQGTAHAHYAAVLLHEIGRGGSTNVNGGSEGQQRSAYALAGGLALGLVMCGTGDPSLAVRLRSYMMGGLEGDSAPPAATVALGLVYMRSGNKSLSEWLRPPRSPYMLDACRPDLLMLRTIARGLVLWDEIDASEEWVDEQVPESTRAHCFVKPTEDNIDYEAMNQAYCNITAGACFSMGLRFAGSGCEEARDACLHFARLFLALGGKPVGELAGRSTLETCLCVCLLAAAMVMSGRGDVEVLRVCRRLRARVHAAPAAPQPLAHGGQMAVHCAVGLLFLGGGRCTLSSSPLAVAALLAAFYPKFPTHSEDNRYHLQAFRHLYVLATEARLILPRDLDTGKLCYAHIQVIDLKGAVKEMKAPCIIPEVDTLREVKINDPRYWPITFQRDRNWSQLHQFLEHSRCIEVKQRAGCLSYVDDPQGFLTLLAQTLTLDRASVWSVNTDTLQLFSNDEAVLSFVNHYLSTGHTGVECGRRAQAQALSLLARECCARDVLCALPAWTSLLEIINAMDTSPTSYHIWQIKLLQSLIDRHDRRSLDSMKVDDDDEDKETLVSTEFARALKQKVASVLDAWELSIQPFLRKYLGLPSSRRMNQCDDQIKKKLCAFVVYHGVRRGVIRCCDDFVSLLRSDCELSAEAVSRVAAMFR